MKQVLSKDNETDHLQLLRKLVEDLATSGSPALNGERLKSLKKICRSSDFLILALFQLLMKYLKRKHAEIRLSTFQILDEIFQKSHCFRELVLKNFKNIAELTIVYDSIVTPLKPHLVAQKLRTLAIGAIHTWHEKFRGGYRSLELGYKYLKECKNVDFEGLAVITEQDRQRREEERRKEEEIRARKIERIVNEMNEESSEISTLVLEFNNAFKLLIPDLDNFFIPLEPENKDSMQCATEDENASRGQDFEFGSDVMREHGLTKETTVQVNLSNIHKVQETPDNEAVISILKEKVGNIKKHIFPKLKEWEQSIMPYSASQPELLRKIIDFKASLQFIIKRYTSLSIVPATKEMKKPKNSNHIVPSKFYGDSNSDDDDDDFIEVPFDDPRVLQATASEAALFKEENASFKASLLKTPIDARDLEAAGSSGAPATKTDNVTAAKKKKTDFSVDSFLKENCEEPLKFQNAITDLSRVWSGNAALHDHEEEGLKSSDMLGIATRAVNFEREWEPVRWACQAPLPTGRLCPRKDRECCPLHGLIVPRDTLGKPVLPEDFQREQQRLDDHERTNPPWQNPVLLAEIHAATGVDLDMKKVKKKKRKYPNLTDIKAQENNPRNRLETKVFCKKSLKRINKAMAKFPS